MSEVAIAEILQKSRKTVMSLPGVVGIGQGFCDGELCIKVFLAKRTQILEEKILKELTGCKVQIEETGTIRARNKL